MSGVTTAPPRLAPVASRPPAATLRVAFQGEAGAYSAEAVGQRWGDAAAAVPCRTFADVVAAVRDGVVEFGLLPVENTLAGSVVAAYDALAAAAELRVVGETVLPIHHCVLAPPGATLAGLESVASHPVALAQCARFFEAHSYLDAQPVYDTAGAAKMVAERGDPRRGALAGRGAAARYGLAVLAAEVEDRADNQTRFFVLSRGSGVAPAAKTPARTALLAVTPNVPGALAQLLAPLAEAGLNLSKLESRPTGVPWEYRFVLEVEHAGGDARLDAALDRLRRASRSLRVLGTFARHVDAPTESHAHA